MTTSTHLSTSSFPTLSDYVGNTPLVELQRLDPSFHNVRILAKLEGNNPAGSVKDRPAFNMILQAEQRGDIQTGDNIIEATSGNTGIALAMVSAMRGYNMTLIMPKTATQERKDAMRAYGATLIEIDGDIETARDLALQMQAEGKGIVLDQFNNSDNKNAHYLTTGAEIWQQTQGRITHFISAMGTTGTISGTAKYLKEKNPNIQVIGLQPAENAKIAGIRRWGAEYMPSIYDEQYVDKLLDVTQTDAEIFMRQLARTEGICSGVSSGANYWASYQIAKAYQEDKEA
ncbi:MAG: cysteine synthase CysM, partial [Moraxellaceae bacterium]|nr:cysteine synthase CysM [Moraxellaceae bacterium]